MWEYGCVERVIKYIHMAYKNQKVCPKGTRAALHFLHFTIKHKNDEMVTFVAQIHCTRSPIPPVCVCVCVSFRVCVRVRVCELVSMHARFVLMYHTVS